MLKRRIRKQNQRNWVIETYVSGEIIKKGRFKGQKKKPEWQIDGYYGRLEDIPNGLMKLYLGCSDSDVRAIKDAIEKAKQECLDVINEFIEHKEDG